MIIITFILAAMNQRAGQDVSWFLTGSVLTKLWIRKFLLINNKHVFLVVYPKGKNFDFLFEAAFKTKVITNQTVGLK